MEHGQPLRENEKVASLLKDVGQRLMIAEREVEAIPIRKPQGAPSASTAEGSAAGATATTTTTVILRDLFVRARGRGVVGVISDQP